MAEPTRDFFTTLAEQHQPLLESLTGVLRFDLVDGERTEHWYLVIRKGAVSVSHKGPEPDCTVTTELATFEAIVSGKMNAMAAMLRGAVEVQGRFALLTAVQRLFDAPADDAPDEPAAGYARRRS
jgi:putative sterol carrier protein